MDRKYLKKTFDHNELQIQRVVNEKITTLRAEIEMLCNNVFLIYDELLVTEQNLTWSQEVISDTDKRFSFANWFLILVVPVIYFIDLLLSQDAIIYLLPESLEDAPRQFFVYLVPALFVVADLAIGLVRQSIKVERDENGKENSHKLLTINGFGFLFCLILPALVGATILAFTESDDIAGSEITARTALMVLSFILHFFVIFLFPKKAFDYCFNYSSYKNVKKEVIKKERELYKKISELSISVLNYKQKADKYAFVLALDKIEFFFRSRVLINQISRSDAWNDLLEKDEKLQVLINDDEFFFRFFPYKKSPIAIAEEVVEVVEVVEAKVNTVEQPLDTRHKPRYILVNYVQNDTAW